MPVIAGFDKLASVKEEEITEKIRRRVVSGKQGTLVYWRMKAGARAAAHKHPHEQIVWMIKGTMDFRIGEEKRSMKAGDGLRSALAKIWLEKLRDAQPSVISRALGCAR